MACTVVKNGEGEKECSFITTVHIPALTAMKKGSENKRE